jgi:hypothetical protein
VEETWQLVEADGGSDGGAGSGASGEAREAGGAPTFLGAEARGTRAGQRAARGSWGEFTAPSGPVDETGWCLASAAEFAASEADYHLLAQLTAPATDLRHSDCTVAQQAWILHALLGVDRWSAEHVVMALAFVARLDSLARPADAAAVAALTEGTRVCAWRQVLLQPLRDDPPDWRGFRQRRARLPPRVATVLQDELGQLSAGPATARLGGGTQSADVLRRVSAYSAQHPTQELRSALAALLPAARAHLPAPRLCRAAEWEASLPRAQPRSPPAGSSDDDGVEPDATPDAADALEPAPATAASLALRQRSSASPKQMRSSPRLAQAGRVPLAAAAPAATAAAEPPRKKRALLGATQCQVVVRREDIVFRARAGGPRG